MRASSPGKIFAKKYMNKKKECIPVGCVPPACCPYLPACTGPRGVYPVLGGCACPRGVCLFWEVYLVLGVYLTRHSPRGQNHRRLWKYNLAPTSLPAVISWTDSGAHISSTPLDLPMYMMLMLSYSSWFSSLLTKRPLKPLDLHVTSLINSCSYC